MRTLACRKCADKWEVHEIPRPFIDPNLYRCPECRNPTATQLGLLEPREQRRDTITYDPAIAAIPY